MNRGYKEEASKRTFWSTADGDFDIGRLIGVVAGGIVLLALIIGSIYTIPAGSVGVVTQWGAVKYVVQPGLGFKVPIMNGVVRMDTRTQKDEVPADAASKDLQTVKATIAVNYNLDPAYAVWVYQTIGPNYPDVVIAPAIQNVFKATTAQFTAEQLITQRELVRQTAEKALADQLATYHVISQNLNIVNFDFSPEFNTAIEQKQVAQQQVETAKQKLAQAQVDAQAVVAAAQGQADAQKALKDTGALSPEYLQYLAITKWNGILPNVTGGASPFIDVSQFLPQPVTSGGK